MMKITTSIHISGQNKNEYWARRQNRCSIIRKGRIDLWNGHDYQMKNEESARPALVFVCMCVGPGGSSVSSSCNLSNRFIYSDEIDFDSPSVSIKFFFFHS